MSLPTAIQFHAYTGDTITVERRRDLNGDRIAAIGRAGRFEQFVADDRMLRLPLAYLTEHMRWLCLLAHGMGEGLGGAAYMLATGTPE